MKPLEKQLMYFNAFKEIVSIFGQIEIGCEEVDVESLATYLSSDRFFFDSFTANTEEEMQEQITELIENGFPVWRFLKCSDWTKNMVEKSFKDECEREKEKMLKTYKCLSCQYYECRQTHIGFLEKCLCDNFNKNSKWNNKRNDFKLKKSCKNYIKREEN